MNLNELRKQPHLSASGVKDYIDCGLHYRFSRVDRLEPEFRMDSMVFGSTIHKAIADFHLERMSGNLLSLDELQHIFVSHWKKAAEGKKDIRYKKGKDFGSRLLEGKKLIEVYLQSFSCDGLEVLAIEEPFAFSIIGLDVPVIGVFDLVEQDPSGTIVVSDLKTSSRAYSTDDIDRSFQLTLYGMAAKANGYRDRELLLRFDCLVKSKSPRFDQHYTTRAGSDERRALSKLQRVWDGITKGVFIPNDGGWKCYGCEFKNRCRKELEG